MGFRVLVVVISAAATGVPVSAADFSPRDINSFYPAQAYRLGVEGQALLSCGVDDHARLKDCSVVWEHPNGSEFGAAARRLTLFNPPNPAVTTQPIEKGYLMLFSYCLHHRAYITPNVLAPLQVRAVGAPGVTTDHAAPIKLSISPVAPEPGDPCHA
jgi:hypothetical protein